MPAEPDNQYSLIRKLLPFSTAALIIALLYVGWIFYSRWQENRRAEQKAAAAKAADARRTIEQFGGGRLTILNFYATPATVHRGEKAQLCYGVSNAKTVRIDPPVAADVWPSISHCIEVAPTRDTSYTLTAEDGAGHSAMQKLLVSVK
ncbi:MAG TPA: hypothetical protein VEG30_15305 [Terriglobales bacterium]|nr:hypothetical protein [Terriglobales bacterium]